MSKRTISSILTGGLNLLLILVVVFWAINFQCIHAQKAGDHQGIAYDSADGKAIAQEENQKQLPDLNIYMNNPTDTEQKRVILNRKTPNIKQNLFTPTDMAPNQEVSVSMIQERPDYEPQETMGEVVMNLKPTVDLALSKYSLSFHSGFITFFKYVDGHIYSYKISYAFFAFDFDYHLTRQLSLVAFAGFNPFKPKAAMSYLGNTYWWNLSANFKLEISTKTLGPYINGGFGLYIPKSGASKPGFNVGAGLHYNLNPHMILEIGTNYHHILTTLNNTLFLVTNLGLIYRF